MEIIEKKPTRKKKKVVDIKVDTEKVVLIEKEEKDLSNYPYFGNWHNTEVFYIETMRLTVCGTITGCGLSQMHGISVIKKAIPKEELNELFKPLKLDGVGAIIVTLGEDYFNKEQFILESGFEFMSEYINFRHSETYKQRIYIFKL